MECPPTVCDTNGVTCTVLPPLMTTDECGNTIVTTQRIVATIPGCL